MALTPQELEQWVNSKINTSVEPNWADQNDISQYRGIGIKYDKQLQDLDTLYSSKINRLIDSYERDLTVFSSYIKNFNLAPIELKGGLKGSSDKVMRLAEKWLATKREIEGRTKGYFTRNPVGTVYYIDLDNGSDASPHDGLKVGNYTADSGTGTTTLIETAELGRSTNGDWNGAYLYNVTRSIGVQITTSVYSTGTWTLTHPTITGQVSGDTYFIIDAWKTLEQYTTVTGRSVGDIAYVRANTSETVGAADIVCDENGDEDDRISIIGCDSVMHDYWSDSSDVKPIVDFNSNANLFYLDGDHWWYIERMVYKNGASGNGQFYINSSFGKNYLKSCEARDGIGSVAGFKVVNYSYVIFDNCLAQDVGDKNFNIHGSSVKLISCVLDGGSSNQSSYGIYVTANSHVELVDSELGQNSAHGTDDIWISDQSKVWSRNTKLGIAGVTLNTAVERATDSFFYEEDEDGTKGNQKATFMNGVITKDTSITRSGGADNSAKMEPNIYCGTNYPLTLNNNSIIDYPFKVWCKGGTERTITIYIRSLGVWSPYPTASELYVEALYLDHAINASRTVVQSNDVLDDETTWRAFDVTFTPQQEGFVYLNVYLKKYVASKGCYVDIRPVIS